MLAGSLVFGSWPEGSAHGRGFCSESSCGGYHSCGKHTQLEAGPGEQERSLMIPAEHMVLFSDLRLGITCLVTSYELCCVAADV